METLITQALEVVAKVMTALLSPLLLLYILWVVLTGKTITSYMKFNFAID